MFDCLKFRGLTSHRFVTWGARPFIFVLLFGFVVTHGASGQEADTIEVPSAEEVASPVDASVPPQEPAPEVESEDPGYGMDAIRGANAYLDEEERLAEGGGGASDSPIIDTGTSEIRKAVLRMVGALSVVLALILLCFWGIRRFGKRLPVIGGRQLGQVIGQVHLTRDATLHYVRTGGRVLVVAVTSEGVNLVAEFGESAFNLDAGEPEPQGGLDADQFVAELKQQSAAFQAERSEDDALPDDDMAVLRSDIHRLQEYLQEETRDPKD